MLVGQACDVASGNHINKYPELRANYSNLFGEAFTNGDCEALHALHALVIEVMESLGQGCSDPGFLAAVEYGHYTGMRNCSISRPNCSSESSEAVDLVDQCSSIAYSEIWEADYELYMNASNGDCEALIGNVVKALRTNGRSLGCCDPDCGALQYLQYGLSRMFPNCPRMTISCNEMARCTDGTLDTWIAGEWAVGASGRYKLVGCPAGYKVHSSAQELFSVTVDHDVQRCEACRAGDEYILDAVEGSCEPCPPGLDCSLPHQPEVKVAGSVWSPSAFSAGVLTLMSCPPGYSTRSSYWNGANASAQECVACGAGMECPEGGCRYGCTPCPAGRYKGCAGPERCSACPADTYLGEAGGARGEACVACPAGSSTRGLTGQTRLASCTCDDMFYAVWNGTRMTCAPCPLGAVCHMNRTCGLSKFHESSSTREEQVLAAELLDRVEFESHGCLLSGAGI